MSNRKKNNLYVASQALLERERENESADSAAKSALYPIPDNFRIHIVT